MDLLNRLLKNYNKSIEIITIILFCFMIISVLIQVFYRYILSNPIMWIEELSRILLIWNIFLGSIIAHYNYEHPGIDYFINKIPSYLRKYFELFIHTIIYIVIICLFFYSIRLYFLLKFIKTPALGLGFRYIIISVTIMSFSIFVNQLKFTHNFFLRNFKKNIDR
jgi:TRAP-type transport system small permease protein